MELTNFQMVLLIVVFVALVAALISFIVATIDLGKKVREDEVWKDMADQKIKEYEDKIRDQVAEIDKLTATNSALLKDWRRLDRYYKQKDRVRIKGKFAPNKVETRETILWQCNTTSYAEFSTGMSYTEDINKKKMEYLLSLIGNDGNTWMVEKVKFIPVYE